MKVRLLICFLLGVGFSFTLQAQDNVFSPISPSEFQRNFAAFSVAPSLPSAMNQLAYDEEKYRKFKKMRTAGMVLTGVGVGLITTGIVLGNSSRNYDEDDWGGSFTDAVGGAICILLGTVSTGGGVTFWIIGNNKMKKYGNTVNLQSTKNGLGLAYSF
ncbi:MAG: hypothetical protein KIT80_04815 [Chitinophagaceae bacterium]|nr:hypothetical protein [Chitinophagaceae bacterium]MCW5926214.1 hypothetical protein [Chitinophagaceae bacterium]